MDWQSRLDTFLTGLDGEFSAAMTGVLVCGSYITGGATNHSDLDVHLVLREGTAWRERGNRIVDGLLIEYFANPPAQIRRYFSEDMRDGDLMCPVQFATGSILRDDTGEISALKSEAVRLIDGHYAHGDTEKPLPELTRYFIWDMLDDLQDACDNSRPDFDFLYYNLLNRLVSNYMRHIGRPYAFKAILGNITSSAVREKYLLRELPHAGIAELIRDCILAEGREEKTRLYRALTEAIYARLGGFDIDGFSFRSPVSG